MQILVDGLLTHYETYGAPSASAVVILHGWADSSASWRGLAKSLSSTHYVIVPDLPGFGESEAPPGAWGLDNYAQFVANMTQKLSVSSYALIGHSNGGAIALRALAEGTLSATQLVLLASAGVRTKIQGSKRALQLLTKTGKVITWPLPSSLKRKLRGKLYATIGSDLLVAEHMQATFKRIVSEDVQADAAKVTVPTLLVYGDTDNATPLAFGEQFHQLINGSTLEVIGGAGHFLQIDAPNRLQSIIEDFLK